MKSAAINPSDIGDVSAAEMKTIRDTCRFDASDGHMELFKTTNKYDGDPGREIDGFPLSAELPV